jgi:lipopolysaccharide transport system permease protein
MQTSHAARFNELLYMLTWRDIKVRYKQSVMGFLWAILTPLLVIGAGIVVRVGLARYSGKVLTRDEIMSLMVRAVPWTFFVSALRFGTNSLLGNSSLVTKVAFPKSVFPLSAMLCSCFDFVIASTALVVVLFILGWFPSVHVLWAIVLLSILAALVAGLTLLLSAANLFFRDVKYLVEIILTYAIFLSPVLYDASFVGEWQWLLMLNPMSPVLEGLSAAVVYHRMPDPWWTAYSALVAAIFLLIGVRTFRKLEPRFAESI